MPATSVSGRPSITSVGTFPSGLSARNDASRVSFLRNDSGWLSNGIAHLMQRNVRGHRAGTRGEIQGRQHGRLLSCDPNPGQSLESAVACDNRGNMCRPQFRKGSQHRGSRENDGGHGARVQSPSREAQSAFCSVVLRRSPCFLCVENLADVPPPRSPRRNTWGQSVRSYADGTQAIVLEPNPQARATAAIRSNESRAPSASPFSKSPSTTAI